MKYKVIGDMHLWGWTELREEVKGTLIEYELNGIKILNQIIEVAGAVENKEEIENKYNVKFEEVN